MRHTRFQRHGSFLPPLFILALSVLFISPTAQAVPSFTRQTGVPCSGCHTQSFGPNLTPFGRKFKLEGYTMSTGTDANSKLPPISGMVVGSFTNTSKKQDPANFRPGYDANNNFTFDEASLFYAGKIYGKVGAFSQLTFDGYAHRLALDNTDIRFADNTELAGLPLTYGISVNNNPTVQDLWNTTAWGFPYTESAVQPGVGAGTLIDGGLATQVGGASAYTMINDLLYLEAGGYTSLSNNFQKGLGVADAGQSQLAGAAPYWRAALQKDWKGHNFALGHYGLLANVYPGRNRTTGTTDHYTDIGFDATYQYLANTKHIFEAKSTYIYEDQQLSASRALGGVSTSGNTYLTTYKLNLAYTFDQTYGVTFGYNKTRGSRDALIYGDYTLSYKPNSEYYTAELVYVPFGKSNATRLSPWLNLRTSLQYIGYSQANGTGIQSSSNNTFMVNGWIAF